MPTANMSLNQPASGAAAWNGPLNSNFGLVDLHDHSSGKGVRVPTSGLNINADLEFNGSRATELRALKFNAATSESSVQDYSIYTSGGELYYKKAATTAVQITSNGAISTASIGGFGGDYAPGSGVGAAVYDSTNARYIFKTTDNDTSFDNQARVAGSQFHTYGTTSGIIFDSTSASSNFRLGTGASGGNLILSSGATVYTGALSTNTNILEISPGGNVGVGTAGTGTGDRFNVRVQASGTSTSVGNVVRLNRTAETAGNAGHGGRIACYARLGAGSDDEVVDLDWVLASSTESYFQVRTMTASSRATALEVGRVTTGTITINRAANLGLGTSANDTFDIGTNALRFRNLYAAKGLFADVSAGLATPASAADLATRHAFNCILAWGLIDGSNGQPQSSTHYNIAATGTRNSAGDYSVNLDVACSNVSAILVTIEDLGAFHASAAWTDTDTIHVQVFDAAGVATDKDFWLLVVGRPNGTP